MCSAAEELIFKLNTNFNLSNQIGPVATILDMLALGLIFPNS